MALLSPKDISSANPADICRFFAWKDKSGKTQVHFPGCSFLDKKGIFRCSCPSGLPYGTVDSYIGKLRAIF